METVVLYVLKSSGLITLFYVTYMILLRKETFFTSNRWFLLSGLVTSFLLPLLTIKKVVYIQQPKIDYSQVVALPTTVTLSKVEVVESFDWTQLIWMGYLLIALFFIAKIAFNFLSFYNLIKYTQTTKQDGFKLINLNKNIAPFSFFNYIVFNQSLYSKTELESILLHEKIHSKEKHSIDVIISQIICSIFWFCPIIWLYKKALLQNLEYIADQKATAQLEDKKAYQMALIKVISNQNYLSITNNFYQSLIKKRIVMLNTNPSQKINSWKYSLVLPFLIGFIFLFQVKTEAQVKEGSSEKTSDVIFNEFSSIITKDATDEDLKKLEKTFTENNRILKITKIKRNKNGEIIAIKLTFDCGDPYNRILERQSNNPLHDIEIYVSTDKYDIESCGFREAKAIKSKVFDVFKEDAIEVNGLQTDENQNFWSIDNMKKNGKDVVLIINGKVKEATEKIQIPMNEELGKMKELTASAFEKKYKIKADKDKYYYEVETVKVKKSDLKSNKVIVYSRDKKSELNKLFIINGKEILQDDIPKGTSISLDGEIIELGKEEGIRKYGLKAKDGVLIFDGISTYTVPFKEIKSDETNQKNDQVGYVFDKISSDNEFESAKHELKEKYNIAFKVNHIKRNAKGEIIALKLSFDDQKGIKGKTEQIRDIAIRPIFLKVKTAKNGTNDIGFYDNHTMKTLPKDEYKERKITLIESLKDDAIIYVDGVLYSKEDIEELDVNGLESIKVVTDAKSLEKYNVIGKKEVVVIETNWKTKKPKTEDTKINYVLFTNDNGDEIVYNYELNYLKVPQFPSVKITENSPLLLINGVKQSNPLETFKIINFKKIESVRVFNAKNESEKGSTIEKIVIKTN